jgi:hypothetical protein
MPEQLILDNDYATLRYLPEEKIIYHTFKRPIGGDPFREVLMNGTQLLTEHQAKKWLSDDRKNSAFDEDDTYWINNSWLPGAIQAGWKFWALVVPEELAGRLSMDQFVEPIFKLGVWVMVFTELDEAKEWLMSVG